MGEISKNQMSHNLYSVALMVLLLLCMVIPVYKMTDPAKISCNIFELDHGWNVKVNGDEYENVTLSEFAFDTRNRGDRVEYWISLPVGSMIKSPMLELYSVHSVIDVYLDNELIYTYGHEIYES